MQCPSCQASVADDSLYCSVCGAKTGEIADAEVERKLAEANLLRMRKQWQDAEARCVDVLRADPDNVHAHSLLGDIYRDQGKMTEASQWYQMALDLDPNSKSDKQKQAEAQRQPSGQKAIIVGVPSGGTQRLMGLISPVHAIQALTAVAVVFAALVIVLLVAARSNRSRVNAEGRDVVYGTPLPMPKGATATPPAAPSSQSTRRANPAIQPPASGYTQQEFALKDQLDQRADLGPDFSIWALTIDPQAHRVNLALRYQPAEAPTDAARIAILRAAAIAAQDVFDADRSVQSVAVNIQMDSDHTGRYDSVFGGEIARSTASSLPRGAGLEQLISAFSETWWAPALQTENTPASGIQSQNGNQ